jgi:hypothetical protein
MNDYLQFNSQKWKLWDSHGMKLFLPRTKLDNAIYFQADWSFVPPEVDAETLPLDAPRVRLRLIGFVPGLRDWRDLEKLFLGYHDPVDGSEPSETRGPDMWIFQPGETSDPEYGKWETDLKFGERRGHEFEFSLEAYKPSERVSKFKGDNAVKQFFNQPVPPDWELPEWINEGDRLSFEGRVELREILCSVPLNSAKPVELARQLARRELALEQFGTCSDTGAGHVPGNRKPEEGISETGRLVVLQMPDAAGESGRKKQI